MAIKARDRQLEADTLIRKIAADFEQLQREIDAAAALLDGNGDQTEELDALRRARDAARKGAALARSQMRAG